MAELITRSSPYAFWAFYSLYRHLSSKNVAAFSFETVCEKLYPNVRVNPDEKVSLFVTWHQMSETTCNYRLRGCIGTFAKLPVVQGVERYAIVAALEDSRFSPIAEKELPKLECSCNILHNFETIFKMEEIPQGDIHNWEVGQHGIELRFRDPSGGRTRSATFLPEVMPEQKWNQEETFINLIEKAGCWKSVTKIMENPGKYFIEVIRYEATKSEITYKQFIEELGLLGAES